MIASFTDPAHHATLPLRTISLHVPRDEDPPPLQAYKWHTRDRGVLIFSLTPLPLSNLYEGFIIRITYLTNVVYNNIGEGYGTY